MSIFAKESINFKPYSENEASMDVKYHQGTKVP